jgi:hypothetical protein
VLDARDAPQGAFEGIDDVGLDRARLGARPGDHHIHHRHADLGLLFAGRGQQREDAGGEGGPDEERRELAVREGRGDSSGKADLHVSGPQ